MTDVLVILAFFAMVLSPCFVAMATGVADGAELGVRNLSEPGPDGSDKPYIPG